FETVLLDELIPYVDANFRTLSDQPHRAMAGLSMGAMETKTITFKHLDTFSHIGLFSGGSITLDDVNGTPGYRDLVELTFVSYGSRELGGGRGGRGGDPRADSEALKKAGINSVFYVSPDTAHEFQTWRRSMREFAPLLFRNGRSSRITAPSPPARDQPYARGGCATACRNLQLRFRRHRRARFRMRRRSSASRCRRNGCAHRPGAGTADT